MRIAIFLRLMFCFLVLSFSSCRRKNINENKPVQSSERVAKKTVPGHLSLLINNKAMSIFGKYPLNSDSLKKADRLMDSAMKSDRNVTAVFIINKINILKALKKRKECLNWCDTLILKKKLKFYPFFLKGNFLLNLNQPVLANYNYRKAVLLLTNENNISCNDLLFLLQIFLILDDKKSVSVYYDRYKTRPCKSLDEISGIIKDFNKKEFLLNY